MWAKRSWEPLQWRRTKTWASGGGSCALVVHNKYVFDFFEKNSIFLTVFKQIICFCPLPYLKILPSLVWVRPCPDRNNCLLVLRDGCNAGRPGGWSSSRDIRHRLVRRLQPWRNRKRGWFNIIFFSTIFLITIAVGCLLRFWVAVQLE